MTSTSDWKSPQHCQHCGCIHYGTCPRIESIEYYPDGIIKLIRFHPDRVAPQVVREDSHDRS